MDTQQLQKTHYDKIATEYATHYGDIWSQKYRYKFFNEPMFANIALADKKVVEAMCGSGETTGYLLANGARVIGIDISEQEINHFRERWTDGEAICASILKTGLESNSCDVVAIVGGLHHVHPHVSEAIAEIDRILKPGGYLCFLEPHKGSLPDVIRNFWYKRDRKYFADNEEAIDLNQLKKEFSSKFLFVKEEYKGNVAYLFVLSSLILRIPLSWKPIYSPFLLWLESLIEKFQGKLFSCVVICQWQKNNYVGKI